MLDNTVLTEVCYITVVELHAKKSFKLKEGYFCSERILLLFKFTKPFLFKGTLIIYNCIS